jgi:hypothetical protein
LHLVFDIPAWLKKVQTTQKQNGRTAESEGEAVIRSLADPSCEGSEEVLKEIKKQRREAAKKVGSFFG